MLLKDLQTLATKLATGTLFHVEKAGKAYSVDYSALAKAIIEEYADSTVGGSKQSVQAAIGALNSRLKTFAVVETGDLPEGNSKTIDLSAYQRRLFLLIVTSGAYVINAWGGSMIMQAIKETTYGTVSIDSFSKTLTIKTSSENTMLYSLIRVH